MKLPHLLLCLALMIGCSGISAQQAVHLDANAMGLQVRDKISADYPPIAKAARVQGTVVVNVLVSEEGKVTSSKFESGPPMLAQAALNAVKQWSFRPYTQSGKAVSFQGPISVEFNLGDGPEQIKRDEEIAKRYFAAEDLCRASQAKKDNSTEAGDVCVNAAKIADEFEPNLRFIEKRSAYVAATWTQANCGRSEDALVWANKAVDTVKLGHDDNSGKNAVYTARAIVYGDLKRWSESDNDFVTAEDYGRKAIQWAESVKFEHLDYYKRALDLDLRLHAMLLQGLKHPEEATKKLEEAEALKDASSKR